MARYDGRPEQGGPAHKPQSREIARIVGAIVGLVVLIAFILDNSQTVRVGFVIFHSNVSLIWALLIAAILGALVDRLVIVVRRHRKAGPRED